jgi:hypothetical protein
VGNKVLTCRKFGAFVVFLCPILVDSCLLSKDYIIVIQAANLVFEGSKCERPLVRYSEYLRKDQTMKKQRILKWPIVLLMLVITSNFTSLHAVTVRGLVEKAIYDGIKYLTNIGDDGFDAVGTASAGAVVIDASESHQKGWYGEKLVYDQKTTINGWQSDPVSINKGEFTTDHRYYPANFEYYDLTVYFRDPEDPSHFVSSRTMVGDRWYEPDFYLEHHMSYVIWATTKKSNTKHRVCSNYSMQSGPDDRLREPGQHTVEVRYKVYQLSYTKNDGMVFTPDNKQRKSTKRLSAIADDNTQLALLGSQQWMMEGPDAFGWVKRDWDKQLEATVHSSMIQPVPVGVPTGGAPVTIREIYRVREESGN